MRKWRMKVDKLLRKKPVTILGEKITIRYMVDVVGYFYVILPDAFNQDPELRSKTFKDLERKVDLHIQDLEDSADTVKKIILYRLLTPRTKGLELDFEYMVCYERIVKDSYEKATSDDPSYDKKSLSKKRYYPTKEFHVNGYSTQLFQYPGYKRSGESWQSRFSRQIDWTQETEDLFKATKKDISDLIKKLKEFTKDKSVKSKQ